MVFFPPGKEQGQKVQTVLLPGLIPALELPDFSISGLGEGLKQRISLLSCQDSLAWKSMYGLSSLLRSQTDTRMFRTLVVRKP